MNRNAPKHVKNSNEIEKKREFHPTHQFHTHIYTT